MTTWITICDTCRREDRKAGDMARTDGEALAELIEAAAEGTGVRTRRVSCLMGCKRACNVAVQAPEKLAYALGGFEPTRAVAEAIVAYAVAHAESGTGQVPFRAWPEAVKVHFVARLPPLEGES